MSCERETPYYSLKTRKGITTAAKKPYLDDIVNLLIAEHGGIPEAERGSSYFGEDPVRDDWELLDNIRFGTQQSSISAVEVGLDIASDN